MVPLKPLNKVRNLFMHEALLMVRPIDEACFVTVTSVTRLGDVF